MSTRSHVHEESFQASPEELFRHLLTPSSIRNWWSAARAVIVPKSGGAYALAWGDSEDEPDYTSVATIRDFEPGRRFVLHDYRYDSKFGDLPFDADFVVEFLVEPHPDGASLRVTQDGFPGGPEGDEFYAGCQQGWSDTFAGIRRFLGEQGSSD